VAAQVVYRYAGWVFGVEQGRPLETVEQLWRQMEATNVDEFKAAVAMQQMPMFTYVYSDHNGDLFWQSNSWTPDYSDLPLAYDWGVANGPPVPTETSSLKWESIVPWASQPQLTSPAAGGISHANEPPWYATVPMYAPDPSEYEEFPWIAPFPSEPDTGGSFGWRPRACLRYTLQAVADSRTAAALNASNYTRGVSPAGVSFDAFVAASMNVAMESAKHLLDSLLAAAIAAPSCTEVRPIYCNIIGAPWRVNGGHGASLRHHKGFTCILPPRLWKCTAVGLLGRLIASLHLCRTLYASKLSKSFASGTASVQPNLWEPCCTNAGAENTSRGRPSLGKLSSIWEIRSRLHAGSLLRVPRRPWQRSPLWRDRWSRKMASLLIYHGVSTSACRWTSTTSRGGCRAATESRCAHPVARPRDRRSQAALPPESPAGPSRVYALLLRRIAMLPSRAD
jgi:hypothetical protein